MIMMKWGWYLAGALVGITAIFIVKMLAKSEVTRQRKGKMMKITVSSSAFSEGEVLPVDYTCDGRDVSPPLSWSEIPTETKSMALICDDPDAPMGTWIHWVLFNIPPSITNLSEGIEEASISGVVRGNNSWNRTGFGGACPPSGEHRYIFRIYALDTELDLPEGSNKAEVLKAMKGHVLAEGELMGRYTKKTQQ